MRGRRGDDPAGPCHAPAKCSADRVFTVDPRCRSRDPAAAELGIGFVAYSPLGRGFLTGKVADIAALRAGDARRNMPRFQGDNLRRNLGLVEMLKAHAAAENCTPAQLALACTPSRIARTVALSVWQTLHV